MYFLDPRLLSRDEPIIMKNRKENGDFRLSKAYARHEKAEFLLLVPQTLGVYSPKLSIRRDGDDREKTVFFERTETENGIERYSACFSTDELGDEVGLYFLTPLFLSGKTVLAFSSENNVEGVLCDPQEAKPFKLLVYDAEYETPDWYKASVMYHIFVDRFCKGSVPVPCKDTAVLNEDWENGIPQFGEKPGDFCANNMFFGGTLYGIAEKLPYLESLGVNLLYLSPIFDAYSNHKYDTGDYARVDEMFGGDEGLRTLLCACRERGIRVILDGVFNHTGDDSVYFNRYGRYASVGAYQSESSPYHGWFTFRHFPDDYECWWGIPILPKLNLGNADTKNYFTGENGILKKYLNEGVSGYRLDVADELPQSFLRCLRETVKSEKADAVIIGEVWENAADKIAYGERRSYFCGKELDGVMNYPVKDAIVRFVNEKDASALKNTVYDIYSSYPSFVSQTLMNLLGTHDTERILTVLGTERHKGLSNRELSRFHMSDEEYRNGKKKLKIASVLQFTLPGTPSIFYGDEAGIQGGHDPFCRATFPWGHEDAELVGHYRRLGAIRRTEAALCRGELTVDYAENGVFVFSRTLRDRKVTVAVNCSDNPYRLYAECGVRELLSDRTVSGGELCLMPYEAAVLANGREML